MDVVAGADATACIDAQHQYWVAGRTRRTGDGGVGQAYYLFKPLTALDQVDATSIALGKDAMHCLGTVDGEHVAYAWGQGAVHGEVGARRVPSEPAPLAAVRALDVVRVYAMAYTSFWLVHPNEAYMALPKHPRVLASACTTCHQPLDDASVTCERCGAAYHAACVDPPLATAPDGEWFCEACGGRAAASAAPPTPPPNDVRPRKRRRA